MADRIMLYVWVDEIDELSRSSPRFYTATPIYSRALNTLKAKIIRPHLSKTLDGNVN